MPRDVEFLEVGIQQLFNGLVRAAAGGEHLAAERLQINPCDSRQTVSHAAVARRARRRLEHDRIGQNRRRHQPCHLLRGLQAALLEHRRDNRRRRADWFIAHEHRRARLNIRQPVMVDNRDNIRLFQTGDGLALLVVINQYNALAPRPQQVIAAQRADDLLVLVQHGIGAVAALQHRLAHVVDEVVEVKQHDPRMLGNALHGNCLINHPRRAVSVAGRSDNARLAGQTEVLFRQ